ncbi:methyltransferase [Saccharomonospora sp. CUA-673]|uniref:SAM-dependent methyltransferase n=1 Tax=Saccharomonospora sp. CUA-673 TaxID=1904969 RepID=UPI00096103AD|nr:SAM-dependent methyltransferase [Saccharomonospora sp. CUA-673]OLT41369.1 methyltransferase [Saccharomonospora sp. CUA-673]
MAPNDPNSVPEGVDLERPNPARIYDWFLGGTNNWAIDREFGAKAVETFPLVRTMARVGREFLGRGVQHLANEGITQFLDLGSGVPTVGNVHEIADSVNPDSRCVYVDNEPVAVAHSRVLLERDGDPTRHAVVQADLLDVDKVWDAALESGVLDRTKPIGLIAVNVLYFFGPEQDPHGVIRNYMDRLPSGSYLLTSHLTFDGVPDEGQDKREEIKEQYKRSSSSLHMRTREEFEQFFEGLEIVEPGITWTPEWRPELRESPASEEFRDNPAMASGFVGLGRKP